MTGAGVVTETFLHQLDRIARNLTPLLISILLVMISVMPMYIPYFGPMSGNIGVMAVFYWVVYRRDLFPASAAFCLGLWQDIIVGTPLGLNALVFLAVHMLVAPQRRFFQGKGFTVVWWAFAIVAFLATLLGWLLMMVLNTAWLPPLPVLLEFLFTIAVFPFLTWVFARTQHAVLR